MPTIKAVAYNTGSTIPNTSQYGNVVVGTGNQDYSGLNGLQWWASTDLDTGYAIVQPNPAGNTPNPLSIPCYLTFWSTNTFSDTEFINISKQATGQNFTTVGQAQTYLLNNGYWTSYTGGCTTVDVVDSTWITNPISVNQPSAGTYGWSRNNATPANVTQIGMTVVSYSDYTVSFEPFMMGLNTGDYLRIYNYPNPATGYADFELTGAPTLYPINPARVVYDVTLKTNNSWDNGGVVSGETGRRINFFNSSNVQYTSFTTC